MGVMREIRIQNFMDDNLHCKYEFMKTRGYAEAYVDGQMSIESKTENLNKEKKMTREEAIEKHAKAVNNPMHRYFDEEKLYSTTFIKGLEALGLIKFDEVEISKSLLDAIHEARGANFTDKGFIKDMENRGYKIVKKD